MEPLPHLYTVQADDDGSESVTLSAAGLSPLASAPPKEFGGPGDLWSPETLLLAAVADCYALSFRAIASASKFDWISLQCRTQGKLDRVDRATRFVEIKNTVVLKVPTESDESTAVRLLNKAEDVCLISNSLSAQMELEITVESP